MTSVHSFAGTMVAPPESVKRNPKSLDFTYYSSALVSMALIGIGFAGVMAITTGTPVWKIGRAVVEWREPASKQVTVAQNIAVLKLSLRNEGGAGNLPVQIFGRWVVQSGPPESFVLLGTYQREVALTQTAILEAPLMPLKIAPVAKALLEVVVSTGGQETDHKWIGGN